jgi:hypothetical protein
LAISDRGKALIDPLRGPASRAREGLWLLLGWPIIATRIRCLSGKNVFA